MKKSHIFLVIVSFLLPFWFYGLKGQQLSDGASEPMEHQYAKYISMALRLQVQADSLTRTANLKRRELAFSGNESSREKLESHIIVLERESYRVQQQADSLFSQARAIELRLMSGGGRNSASRAGISGSAGHEDSRPLSERLNPDFLVLGQHNISSGLSPQELLRAGELNQEYIKANRLMQEASVINDEIEQLGKMLDSRPRRRERRRINRQIDDLTLKSFDMKMEAMVIYREANSLRYSAALKFLTKKRSHLNDSLVIRSGLEYEGLARENFRQASGLRETAKDLRSDKYKEGFILRAYTEEMNAFLEMERALEIYETPPLSLQSHIRDIPLNSDGRIDPATALSRARMAGRSAPAVNDTEARAQALLKADYIDYGFSILPVSPYSSSNPLPSGFRLPEGIVYSIQLGIFSTILTNDAFGGLYPVLSEREPDNRSVRYLTGVFRSLEEAERALLAVNRQGFSDAFVVVYNNGVKMPINRARQIEAERNAASNQSVARPANPSAGNPVTTAAAHPSGTGSRPATGNSPQSPAQPVAGNAPQSPTQPASSSANPSPGQQSSPQPSADQDRVVFKIQLGAFGQIVQSDVFRNWQNLAGNKNVEQTRNINGLYIYSIGNFNTFEEAANMQSSLRLNGITDAFIVPYNGDRRITIEEANKLLLR
jgi:cell division protein FtsN